MHIPLRLMQRARDLAEKAHDTVLDAEPPREARGGERGYEEEDTTIDTDEERASSEELADAVADAMSRLDAIEELPEFEEGPAPGGARRRSRRSDQGMSDIDGAESPPSLGAKPTAESLKTQRINLPIVPEPRAVPDTALVVRGLELEERSSLGGLIFGFTHGASAIGGVREALRLERQSRLAIERFFEKAHRAIGEAWIAAGAPADVGVELPEDLPEEEDPKIRKERLDFIDKERKLLERMFEKRTGSLQRELDTRNERLAEIRREREAFDAVLNKLRLEGTAAAREIADLLPEEFIRDMSAGGDVRELEGAMKAHRDKLADQEQDLDLRSEGTQADLDEQRADLDRQLNELYTQSGSIQREEAQRQDILNRHMRTAGEQLMDKLNLFANSDEVMGTMTRADGVRDAVNARLSALETAEERLRSITQPDWVFRALVAFAGVLVVAGVGTLLWMIRPQGRMETRTIHTWTLPESVELFGEVRYGPLSRSDAMSELVSSVQTGLGDYPSAMMVVESNHPLHEVSVVGFASVLSERRTVSFLPVSYDVDTVLDHWVEKGADPQPVVVAEDRELQYINDLRAIRFHSPTELWLGDPDLIREIYETADEERASVENLLAIRALGAHVQSQGCLWFVNRRFRDRGAAARLLRLVGIESLPVVMSAQFACAGPPTIHLLLDFGGLISAQKAASMINDGLQSDNVRKLFDVEMAEHVTKAITATPFERLLKVTVSTDAQTMGAIFRVVLGTS